MTCDEVENWMLTDETPNRPSQEVRRHLRSCARCRSQFGRLVRLMHEVQTAPLPPLPLPTRERIVSQLQPPPAAIPVAIAQAQPVAMVVPLTPRRWQLPRHWYRWAAAAALCLVLGFAAVALLPKGQDQQQPDGQNQTDKDKAIDAGHLAVEDRLLERHLQLAEKREPSRRLHVLSDMAADVRAESMEQARKGTAEDLKILVWLHARILHDGVLRVARALPANSQPVLSPVISQLRRAGQSAEHLARTLAGPTAEPMRQLAQQSQQMAVALEVGGDAGQAPSPEPPGRLDARSMLSVLVGTSLQMAQEEDPLKRAEQSTQVAETLTQQLVKQTGKVEDDELTRMSEQLARVMEQAVQPNLAGIDRDRIDDVRRKQLEQAEAKAGAALDQMEPNVREQLPAQAQVNIQRALELARQIKRPPHGKGLGKKEKSRPGRPR